MGAETSDLSIGPASHAPYRVAFVLPGLHRINRGAEVAFESIAYRLAQDPAWRVTVIGSGPPRGDAPYTYHQVRSIHRRWFEHLPSLPGLRDATMYEELSFLPGLMRYYQPGDYDLTVTCAYPYIQWLLLKRDKKGHRPKHVFVTQNSDWPAYANHREFRWFHCDGVVCTNPVYFQRLKSHWPSVLIPNGVEPDLFYPGPAEREGFGLPRDKRLVLMVSALTSSKRVLEAIHCVAEDPDLHLVLAGTGPLQQEVQKAGAHWLPGRFHHRTLPRHTMPALYRSVDAFLHMSLDEPSANAYVEALASGLPIITHDRDVTRWTLEDVGHFVDTTDFPAVRRAIHHAINADSEAQINARRELAVSRFAWSPITNQYKDFCQALIDGSAHCLGEPQLSEAVR
jgi:glycosyltransferase involved in cell wall biosynthesis